MDFFCTLLKRDLLFQMMPTCSYVFTYKIKLQSSVPNSSPMFVHLKYIHYCHIIHIVKIFPDPLENSRNDNPVFQTGKTESNGIRTRTYLSQIIKCPPGRMRT